MQDMTRCRRLFLTLLFLSAAFLNLRAASDVPTPATDDIARDLGRIETDLDSLGLRLATEAHIIKPDSIVRLQGNIFKQELAYFLRHRSLTLDDSVVNFPPFIRKCIDIYQWFDKTFNSHDTVYVAPTGYKGKIEAMGDSWIDAYYFHPRNTLSIRMLSNFYSSVGLKVQYSILSLGYSVNVRNLNPGSTPHRKTEFGLKTARVSLEFRYWENNGSTTIRKFGGFKDGALINEYFDGLKFKALTFGGYYYFNYRKFSLPAAYDASRVQRISQGCWIAGISGTFYDARFDFTKLPDNLQDYYPYPFTSYRLHYNALNLMGGYSYNWVITPDLLFNVSLVPGVGMSVTFDDSQGGRTTHLSYYLKGMGALTYTRKRIFATISVRGDANLFQSKEVGFMSGLLDGKISIGMRF